VTYVTSSFYHAQIVIISCFVSLHITMGWLPLVGSLKLQVSFAKEPYKRDDILQKRPIILRSLLIVATPYVFLCADLRIIHASCGVLIYLKFLFLFLYTSIFILVCLSTYDACIILCADLHMNHLFFAYLHFTIYSSVRIYARFMYHFVCVSTYDFSVLFIYISLFLVVCLSTYDSCIILCADLHTIHM